MHRFGIMGADRRMKCLQQELEKDGYFAKMLGAASDFTDFDVIVLPPACDFKSILEKCKGKTVIAPKGGDGMIGYADLEEFKRQNAKATAEGALCYLMQRSEKAVYEQSIGIVGFGCIGKELFRVFTGLGAKVTVFARGNKPNCLDISRLFGFECDALINTVPAPVVTKAVLASFPNKPIVTDLASRPGGVDFEGAELVGIPCYSELGIPGRYAPRTAGRVLKNTVISILEKVQNDR